MEAASIGTEKVIKDHSTIGIVVTTDGSISDFERNDYVKAEEDVISELQMLGKPYIVILNTTHPMIQIHNCLVRNLKINIMFLLFL